MNTNIALSKDYLNEVVSNYQELMNHIDEIIALSGYRKESVAEKLGLSKSDFYRKEHNKSFNLEEIKQIVELIDEDDDELEDGYFMKIYEERKNGKNITLDELEAMI